MRKIVPSVPGKPYAVASLEGAPFPRDPRPPFLVVTMLYGRRYERPFMLEGFALAAQTDLEYCLGFATWIERI